MQIGNYRLEGGGSCPEQYNVYLGDKEVGYLRLRHGRFTAETPFGGKTVYEARPHGDGSFEVNEREGFLMSAISAIDRALNYKGDKPINKKGSSNWIGEDVLYYSHSCKKYAATITDVPDNPWHLDSDKPTVSLSFRDERGKLITIDRVLPRDASFTKGQSWEPMNNT
jgi:hypothetical protein